MQASNEIGVRYHIEYRTQVQEDEGSSVSFVQDQTDVVCRSDEGCFCAVVGSEAILCDIEELVVLEMVGYRVLISFSRTFAGYGSRAKGM